MNDALLRLLIERAEDLRNEAVSGTVGARKAEDVARKTLDSLYAFRTESLGRSPAGRKDAVGIAHLQVTRHFDHKLVQAIQAQHREHAQHSEVLQQQESVLRDRQLRLTALQALQKRRTQQTEAVALRREQRALDEFATAVAARRRFAREPSNGN